MNRIMATTQMISRASASLALSLLAALFLCLASPQAPAAQARDLIDTGASCSVTFNHSAGASANGARIDLYRVADVSQTGDLTLAGPFAAYGGEVALDGGDWPGTAQVLAAYASRDGISPTCSGTFDAEGRSSFNSLQTGLYLVAIERFKAGSDYCTTAPYMLHLPIIDEQSEAWLYTGVSDVKYDRQPVPSEKLSITAAKVWKNDNTDQRPDSVTVQLLRDGRAYKEATLSKANSWRVIWEGLDPERKWSVVEKKTPQGYTQSVSKQGSVYTVTNTRRNDGSGGEELLPQTGMLLWPIPILVTVGLILIFAGLVRRNREGGYRG